MMDWIISGKTGEVYAEIDLLKVEKIDYFFSGKIIRHNMPDSLILLIKEYDELVAGCSLSLLDEVEESIYSYDLQLKLLKTRIFNLTIRGNLEIDFFTKYPTSKGFLDFYPN